MLRTSLGQMLLGTTFVVMSMGSVAQPEVLCSGRGQNPGDGESWSVSCEGEDGKSYASVEIRPADASSGTVSIQISEQPVCRDGTHIACRVPLLSGGDGSAACLPKGEWTHPYKGDLPAVLIGCGCYETGKSCMSE